MNVKYLKYLISNVQEAQERLEKEILLKIDEEARKKKIDRVEKFKYSHSLWRDGQLVTSKEIDYLFRVFAENIGQRGFKWFLEKKDGEGSSIFKKCKENG
jgi:hypothetical protein